MRHWPLYIRGYCCRGGSRLISLTLQNREFCHVHVSVWLCLTVWLFIFGQKLCHEVWMLSGTCCCWPKPKACTCHHWWSAQNIYGRLTGYDKKQDGTENVENLLRGTWRGSNSWPQSVNKPDDHEEDLPKSLSHLKEKRYESSTAVCCLKRRNKC